MARVRREATEWREWIDKWRASGLGLRAFCDQNGLNFATMSGWAYKRIHKPALEQARREGGAAAKDTPAEAAFVPVRVVEVEPEPEREQKSADRSGVEIVIGEGRRIALGTGFDAETLRRVVAVLEGRTC